MGIDCTEDSFGCTAAPLSGKRPLETLHFYFYTADLPKPAALSLTADMWQEAVTMTSVRLAPKYSR